jgi:hypothetical protein
VGRVELGPRPVRQESDRHRREIQETEPESPIRLVEAGLAEPAQIEHRRDQQHQADHERNEEPGQAFPDERSGRTSSQRVANAHPRDEEQQRHPPQRAPQKEDGESDAWSRVVHEPRSSPREHHAGVEYHQPGYDERSHEVELTPPIREVGRLDRGSDGFQATRRHEVPPPSTLGGSGGGTRTHNLRINSPPLCRLSYPGTGGGSLPSVPRWTRLASTMKAGG